MVPVLQKRSQQDIGHPRQVIRLRKDFVVIAYAVEEGRLGKQQEKAEDGIGQGAVPEYRIQTSQDEPVQIVVLLVKDRHVRMQENIEFEEKRINQ